MDSNIRKIATLVGAPAPAVTMGCASTSKQESASEYAEDTIVTGRVKAVVLGEPTLKSAEINVETFRGVVQLSAFVSSHLAENKAVEVTRTVAGVKSVSNDRRLK